MKYYKNATQYHATFLNVGGGYLSNTDVVIRVSNVNYHRITDNYGRITVNINLNPGVYSIVAFHPNGEQQSNVITVLSTIIGENLNKFLSSNQYYHVQILDGQGNPNVNKSVTFNINGVFYNSVSDSNGVAYLNENLSPDSYIVTAIGPDGLMFSNTLNIYYNRVYSYSNVKLTFISYVVLQGTKLNVKLTQENYLPLSNENIVFHINGVPYTRTTNSNGIASLNINLDPGSYSTSISYGYSTSSINLLVKSNSGIGTKLTPLNNAVWKGQQFAVKLTRLDNNAVLSNQQVLFRINGVLYYKTTDSSGIARLNINLNNPGPYSIVVNYEGTDSGTIYKSSSIYHVIYVGNSNSDLAYNYGTFPDFIDRVTWTNPNQYMISNNQLLSDVICVDNQYIQQLSTILTSYGCLIENVISLNTYVSSTEYQYYLGCNKTSVETLTSFAGNCVDETNLFVALARCANFPSRYVSADSKTGGDEHVWGQILVDDLWICVDNSRTNSNYVKLYAAYQLGNKNYLSQEFNIDFYAYSINSTSGMYGFQVPNNLNSINVNVLNNFDFSLFSIKNFYIRED